MTKLIAKLHIAFLNLKSEDGQDIVEYILLTSMIALAATAGLHVFAISVNAALTNLAGKIAGGLTAA
jgi:Flp pilus assembly pilin Flp